MYLQGTKDQQRRDFLYDASGSITTGGTPQLVLPEAKSRTMLMLGNLSSGNLWFEFDGARATIAISNGIVTGSTVTNGGFGYTVPPTVTLLGGGPGIGLTTAAAGEPTYPAPGTPDGFIFHIGDLSKYRPAKMHAVLTAGVVTSLVIDDAGAGYQQAPYAHIHNSVAMDVYGCADPSLNSGTGLLIPNATQPIIFNGTACPTGPVAVFGASTGQRFTVKFMQ